MLAACSNVIAFLIQNVAIAHPKEAEGRLGRRLRLVGIGMVVVSLFLFAAGIRIPRTGNVLNYSTTYGAPETKR